MTQHIGLRSSAHTERRDEPPHAFMPYEGGLSMEMSTLANLEQSLLLAKQRLVICYALDMETGE